MRLIELTKNSKRVADAELADEVTEEVTETVAETPAEEKKAPKAKAKAKAKVAAEAPAADHDELSALRAIVVGPQLTEFREDIARIENRTNLEIAKMREEIQALGRRLDDRITELDARTTKNLADTQDQLQTRTDSLSAEIQESSQKALETVNQGMSRLEDSKIDRVQLASFLVDLAGQLEGSNAG